MNAIVDTNTKIAYMKIDPYTEGDAGRTIEGVLRRWADLSELQGFFPISVSHSVDAYWGLTVVGVFAKVRTEA